MFDGAEVGGVSGQKQQVTASGFDQFKRGRGLMKVGVVQHDHTARRQRGQQHFGKINVHHLRIATALKDQRRDQLAVPGKLSEIIGCYAWTGVTNTLVNAGNPVNQWGNFGINRLLTQTPFNVTSPQLLLGSASQNITLTWTNNMGAFNLCSSPSLSSPTWSVVTNTPYFGTNRWTITDSVKNVA